VRGRAGAGIDIFAGYGMSETGPIVALAQLPPGYQPASREEEVRLRCSTGRPVPLADFRIVGTDMRELPRDGQSQGEIVLRAPYLTRSYFRKPSASEELWADGYLHTQDVAVVHENGFVQIVDRLKDVIKTGGEWVSSIEIENLVTRVPGVRECAVIGVPDARWGERPMAFVVRQPDSEVGAEDIRAELMNHVSAQRLSKFAVPEADRIAFVAEIPKTSVGKIDKKLLRGKSSLRVGHGVRERPALRGVFYLATCNPCM
jgi:fatty-acyl-CoA synthase